MSSEQSFRLVQSSISTYPFPKCSRLIYQRKGNTIKAVQSEIIGANEHFAPPLLYDQDPQAIGSFIMHSNKENDTYHQ